MAAAVGVGGRGRAGEASAVLPTDSVFSLSFSPLALLRHKFLMPFTDMSVVRLFDFVLAAAVSSMPFRESAEKRLVVFDLARPLIAGTGGTLSPSSSVGIAPLPTVNVSHCAPVSCKGSGDEGCRPNGSGDKGITGDSS